MSIVPSSKNQRQRGFTIVELLIVIVVIAILAAITVVAYNGIQQRATNAATASTISAYIKGLTNYAIVNSSYPPGVPSSGGYACLGENNPGNLCWLRAADHVERATFNDALKPFMGGQLPDTNPAIINGMSGAMFVDHPGAGVTLDGSQYRWYIWYLLAGNATKCPVGQLLSGGWATFTSTTPATGYTISGSDRTQCWIKMPDPTKL